MHFRLNNNITCTITMRLVAEGLLSASAGGLGPVVAGGLLSASAGGLGPVAAGGLLSASAGGLGPVVAGGFHRKQKNPICYSRQKMSQKIMMSLIWSQA